MRVVVAKKQNVLSADFSQQSYARFRSIRQTSAWGRLGDELILVLAWLAATAYWGRIGGIEEVLATPPLIAAVVFGWAAELNGLYQWHRLAPFVEGQQVLASLGAGIGAAWVLSSNLSYEVLWSWAGGAGSVLLAWRMGRAVLAGREKKQRFAVVGATHLGERIKTALCAKPWLRMKFVGCYEDRKNRTYARLPIAGDLNRLVEDARAGKVDCVYVSLPMEAEKRINRLARELADSTVSLFYVPDFSAFDLLYAKWEEIDGLPVVSIYDTPFQGPQAWLKRLTDLVLGSVFLVLSVPCMLLIALAIKLTSPGPVLFKQRRFGLGGEEILVWKFRTMTVCEDGEEIVQAKPEDSRVTLIGKLLRRTSLDELPQLFNVLQGDMSLVGPRPHAVAHNQLYRRLIPGYMLRHKVKPGITGLAQVKGFRGETDTLEKMAMRVHYDLEYVRTWSWWLDMKIIVETVYAVAKGFVTKQVF